MTYMDFVEDYIERQNYADPIFTEDIVPLMAKEYGLEHKKAAAATTVAIKRLMDDDKMPELRRFQKGIFYRTKKTPLGELKIRKRMLIEKKYLIPDKGYETGAGLFHDMGLTTLMPAMEYIATNVVHGSVKYDKKLNVTLCQPKTKITADNMDYLRVLDVLYQMDHIPYDAENPYEVVSGYVRNCKLRYDILLSYADRFYNQKTVLRLGHVAGAEGAMI